MKFWVDAQLPPQLAPWLARAFHVDAANLDEVGLRHADDLAIFRRLSQPGDVLITKDEDFLDLVVEVVRLLESGEPIVQLDRRT